MLVNPTGCQTITTGYDSSAINPFEILHRGKGIYTKESNSLQKLTIFPVGHIMINDILQEQWTIYNNIFSAPCQTMPLISWCSRRITIQVKCTEIHQCKNSKVFQNCWPWLHLAQVHFDESAAKACTLLCDALGLWYFLCSKMFFLCFKGPCFWVKSRKYTLLRFIRRLNSGISH